MLSRGLRTFLATRRQQGSAYKEKHEKGECQECGCPLVGLAPEHSKAPDVCPSCQAAQKTGQTKQAGIMVMRGELATSADRPSTQDGRRARSASGIRKSVAAKQAGRATMELTRGTSSDTLSVTSSLALKDVAKPSSLTVKDFAKTPSLPVGDFAKTPSLTLRDVAKITRSAMPDLGADARDVVGHSHSLNASPRQPSRSSSRHGSRSAARHFTDPSLPLRPALVRSGSEGVGASLELEPLGPRWSPKTQFPSEGASRASSKQSCTEEGTKMTWRRCKERALTALRAELLAAQQDTQRTGATPKTSVHDSPEPFWGAKDLLRSASKETNGSDDTKDSVEEDLPRERRMTRTHSTRSTISTIRLPPLQVLTETKTSTAGDTKPDCFKSPATSKTRSTSTPLLRVIRRRPVC